MKTEIVTDKAPKAIGPYSQGIVSGNMIFTSGQIYITPEGNLLEGTFKEQVHQVMKNLQAVLVAAGADFSHVVKTTVYLSDMSLYSEMNEVYGSYFAAKPFPAREAVCVKELPRGVKIEISMVAVR